MDQISILQLILFNTKKELLFQAIVTGSLSSYILVYAVPRSLYLIKSEAFYVLSFSVIFLNPNRVCFCVTCSSDERVGWRK
jgi:hypothetical protein